MEKSCRGDKRRMYVDNMGECWEGMGEMVKRVVDLLGVEKGKEEGKVWGWRIWGMRDIVERELMGIAMKKGVSLIVERERDGVVLREKEGMVEMGKKLL